MRTAACLVLITSTLLLTGCELDLMSLHPLYTNADTVFEKALEGVWFHKDGDKIETYTFERVEEAAVNGYHIFVDEQKDPYRCRLVLLGKHLFLDVSSKEVCDTCVRGHMFLRVDLSGGALRMAIVDEKWMVTQLENNALPYDLIRDGSESRRVIRASTQQLQAFFSANATNRSAFPEWIAMTRTRQPPE